MSPSPIVVPGGSSRKHYDASYFLAHFPWLHDERERMRLGRYWRRVIFADWLPISEPAIFEFGLGLGQNLVGFARAGGHDISPYALAFCRARGLRVWESMADVPDGSFDVALTCHSLEHVEVPMDVLRQLGRILRVGGYLVVVVPKERHGPASFQLDGDQHLHCWNFRTLNNLILRAGGFTVLRNDTIYSCYGLRTLGNLFGESRMQLGLASLFGRLLHRYPSLRVVASRAPDNDYL